MGVKVTITEGLWLCNYATIKSIYLSIYLIQNKYINQSLHISLHLHIISLSIYFRLFIFMYICIYVFLYLSKLGHWPNEYSVCQQDRGSIPGRVIPKTRKMLLGATLLDTRHYKLSIKVKVEQSRERSSTLSYTSM